MNADFHYYATYCASIIAGYTSKEALRIAYSANFVDCCTRTILKKCKAPLSAATTQSQMELADFYNNIFGRQEITRIWASFHFLPGDLYAPINHGCKRYKNKYRLICKPNSELLLDTVNLAKNGSLEAIGIAMHILADSWAHANFAGTPSLVINNVDKNFFEIVDEKEYQINFIHNPVNGDNINERTYSSTIYTNSENDIMNLGHGRAGHVPDLAFIKYKYLPAWGDYNFIIKDNPSDYFNAFAQMVEALRFLKDEKDSFSLNSYDPLDKYKEKLKTILHTRKESLEEEWKQFAYELSKVKIDEFNVDLYANEYIKTKNKEETLFNNFIYHALKQKSMVVNRIYKSNNHLAGYSIEYNGGSFVGLKDYWKLIEHEMKEKTNGKNN